MIRGIMHTRKHKLGFLGLLLLLLTLAGGAEAASPPSARASMVKWLDVDTVSDGTDGAAYTGSWGGFSQATSAKQPIYKAHGGPNGTACFHFSGTQVLSKATDTGLDSLSASDFTLTLVMRQTTTAGLQGVFCKVASTSPLFLVLNAGKFSDYNDITAAFACDTNRLYVIEFSFHPTGGGNGVETIYENGLQVVQRTGAVPSWDSADPYLIGGYSTAGQFIGDVLQVVADNTILTQAQMTSDVAYFRTRYYDPSQIETTFIGDSRTLGADTTQTANLTPFPYPLQAHLFNNPANVTYNNVGVGGYTTLQCLNDAGYHINPFVRQIAVLWAGFNDPFTETRGEASDFIEWSSCISIYESYYCQTVVLTDIDAQNGAFNTWRTAFNTDIRNHFPSVLGKRVLVDAAADSRVGPVGASLNTLLFCSDHIHPLGEASGATVPGAGYAVMAALVAPAVNTLLQTTALATSGTKRRLQ